MIQISSETQLFIREHSSDDVRALALQAKKYPDIDMPTAITQIAGRQIAAEKIPHGGKWKRYGIRNICRWSNALLKSPPATKPVFRRRFTDRPHRRLRHRLFFSCHRIQVRHLRRTPGRALRNSGTQLPHTESKPYKRKK